MSEQPPVRFSVFELDLQTRELRKHGIRLKLQDQPFQVLQALVERPGEMVTREELQRRIWGGDTFVDFDQGLNRAVNKVREALGDGAETPRFIETLPRRGYRFIATVEGVAATALPLPVSRRSYRTWTWAAGALLFAAAGVWFARDRTAPPAPRLVGLTAFTGTESYPAFSPDGKHVAFTWNGEKQDNTDIYVKVVEGTTALRLTNHAAVDSFPAWSPDGRQIAFASMRGDAGIYLVSPLGGPERKLADLATTSRPAWSPDGRYLLVARRYIEAKPESGDGALYLVSAGGEVEPRPVLSPPRGTWYHDPAYAPDGRSLAFVSCSGAMIGPTCNLQLAFLDHGLVPSGKTSQITPSSADLFGLAWTADGSSLIYSILSADWAFGLWRVGVSGRQEPQKLELAAFSSFYPAIDSKSGRVAFSRRLTDTDIWRLDQDGKSSPFLTSSRPDSSPQYSPDGNRIAFASGRGAISGAIWVANADGTGLAQLTGDGIIRGGTPRWSPDARWIALDAWRKGGGWDIWVIEASGASHRQLTHGPTENSIPSWSRDGTSIYFTSNRTGRFEVWRVPVRGGTPEQITRNGGYVAFESTDGKTLYFTLSEGGDEGLFSKRLPDGDERQVLKENVEARGIAIFNDGVYYLHRLGGSGCEIRFHDFARRTSKVVAKLEGPLSFGLAVSPDRKTLLFTKRLDSGADLMMIENFR